MISVIVPVYNVQDYLNRCIESIANQTYKNIEILLVDDGSTDQSGDICDMWVLKDSRVKVIHKENGGLSSARNAGIDVASGDYLSFIDSDDYIEKLMLETMITAIKKSNKDIACCGRYVNVWGKYTKTEFCLASEKTYSKKEAIRALFYQNEIDVSACDKIYRKSIFEKIRYPQGKISEDAAVIFQIIDNSNGVVHVGRPFYHYVYRNNSISKSAYNQKKHDVIDNLNKTIEFVHRNYPAFKKDCLVYCCINTGTILLELTQDKEAMKKYPEHYKDYMRLFKAGYWYTMISRQVDWKLKCRFLAVKTQTQKIYNVLKNAYQKVKSVRGSNEYC